MSLLWRKNWTSGPKVLPFMVKADTGLAQKCSCCPCEPPNWYIATVCPCPSCGKNHAFIGDLIPSVEIENSFVTMDYGDEENVQIKALTMSSIPATDTNGKVTNWDCATYPKDSVLLAIKHETQAAPFTGTVGAVAYINGAEAATWGPEAITQGNTAFIGDGVTAESESTEILEIDHKFDDAGDYNVDLVVTFSDGSNEETYSLRTTISIVDMGTEYASNPWIGAVAVVPETSEIDSLECVIVGRPPGTSYDVSMFLKILKGPFDSKNDADYVLSHWDGLIHAYAATCACKACWSDWWKAEGCEDGYLTHWSGGEGSSEAFCENGWLAYDASPNETWCNYHGIEITPVFQKPDGTESEAPWSVIVPPCWQLMFKVDTNENIGFNENIGYAIGGGGFEPLDGFKTCCLGDDESPYFEDEWDYTPGEDGVPSEGVPNSSADLRNYEEFG